MKAKHQALSQWNQSKSSAALWVSEHVSCGSNRYNTSPWCRCTEALQASPGGDRNDLVWTNPLRVVAVVTGTPDPAGPAGLDFDLAHHAQDEVIGLVGRTLVEQDSGNPMGIQCKSNLNQDDDSMTIR